MGPGALFKLSAGRQVLPELCWSSAGLQVSYSLVLGYGALGPDLNLLTVFLAWYQPCPITMDLPGASGPDPNPDG